MKRRFIIALVIAAVAVGAGLFYLLSNLNKIVAAAIEDHGSEVTTTKVGVSGVDISLREGRGSIRGLTVDSPEGFEAREVFSLGDITLDIDLASVREVPIVIDEVRIEAPVVHAEFTKTGKSNVDALRERIQQYSSSAGGDRGGSKTPANIRIRKFVFAQGKVEVDASELGLEARTLSLPAIQLTDVGGPNGAPPDQIAKLILGEVAKRVGSEIARSEVDRLIREQLGESLSDKAQGLIDRIKN